MDIDLEQARRRARELLRRARAGDRVALDRLRGDRAPRLADAQRAVARDLGFTSWPALVGRLETVGGDRDERRSQLLAAALGGRDDVVERLLADDPSLAASGLAVALVLGDERVVAEALDRDPDLVARELPDVARTPLACVCHSAFLRSSSGRGPALRRVAALLLAAGADPNDGEALAHAIEADDMACVELLLAHGAAVRGTGALGSALHDAATVRVLLEHGDLRPSDPELRDSLLAARDPAVVELLIAHGAALDARDADGLAPASHAARFRSERTLQVLLAAGAGPELDPAAEWIGAIVRGDHERADRVRARRPTLALRPADAEQLPRWASAGDDVVVTRLLDAGVPIDARGLDRGTALHYAGHWGRGSTVELLLERGADVESTGGPRFRPSTPLGWTAWGSRFTRAAAARRDGYVAATAALLAAGARVYAGMQDAAADDVAALLAAAAERSGVVHDSGLAYAEDRPVLVRVRRREARYDIEDLGGAAAIAGRPAGWLEAARRAVEPRGWNVNRSGVVLVCAVEGREIDALVRGTAEASIAVLAAILALED